MLNDISTPPPEPNDTPASPPGRAGGVVPANTVAAVPGRVAALDGVTPRAPHGVEVGPTGLPHHAAAHVDPHAPGLHPPRVMGEATRIDPIYAMPMEDRGSFFSLMLSAVVVAVFCVLLLIVWWTFFHTASRA